VFRDKSVFSKEIYTNTRAHRYFNELVKIVEEKQKYFQRLIKCCRHQKSQQRNKAALTGGEAVDKEGSTASPFT
jgi:transcription termination factor NusB